MPISKFYLSAMVYYRIKRYPTTKKKAHIEYKTNSNSSNYNKFLLLYTCFKCISKKCLTQYNKHVESLLTENSSDFWRYVKKKSC